MRNRAHVLTNSRKGTFFRLMRLALPEGSIYVTQATYYEQLEQGARYLASRAVDDVERQQHLGWANRYYRLRLDASPAASDAVSH